MGRRKQDPAEQAAKGYPGRRKSKTQRDLERMEREAARDAKLMATKIGKGGILQALPVFLADKRLAAAQAIWKEYAPKLDELHLLTTLDRYTFALFCIYCSEFVLANKDILDKGYSILVTTVAGAKSRDSGSQMPRLNPAVDRRDHAAKMMLQLAASFGFTPLDRGRLIRDHAMRADEETLFGRVRTPLETPDEVEEKTESDAALELTDDLDGLLDRLDSPPPKDQLQ